MFGSQVKFKGCGVKCKDTVVKFIEDYANLIRAPVRCNVDVLALRHNAATQRFVIDTNGNRLKAMNLPRSEETDGE